jgi:hypothetical protein
MGKRYHVSLSNLPLEEWANGVTLCHRKGKLYRIGVVPDGAALCKQCFNELMREG